MRSRDDARVDVRRRLVAGPAYGVLPAVVVAAVLVGLLVGLLFAVRDAAYRATASGAVALPGVVGGAFEVVGELGLVALVVLAVVLAWRARSRDLEHLTVAVVAAVS